MYGIMVKGISLIRRKSFWQIPLYFASLSLAPSFLMPEAEAADLKYPPYNTPNAQTLDRILLANNFPQSFNFKYTFPRNTDLFGDTAQGHFTIRKTPQIISLQIIADHPKEKRKIQVVEVNGGDRITYFEKDTDVREGNLVLYENKSVSSLEDRQPMVTALLRTLFDGNPKNSNFLFQGANCVPREYHVEVSEREDENYDSVLEARIKGEDVRAPKLRVFFKNHNGFKVPIEIWADYKIKIPFPFSLIPFCKYDTHTLRAVLTEKV
jgi:hypothetical protein